MKNLLLVQERLSQIHASALAGDVAADGGSDASSSIAHACLDAASGRVFLVTRGGRFLAYALIQARCTHTVDLAASGLLELGDKVVGLQYLPELEVVVLACSSGRLLTVGEHGAEVAATMPFGIAAMAWSPDEELCVLYMQAHNGQVVVLTKEFDVMYECDLFTTPASPPAPAQLAEAYARFGFGAISWRGDGQFFAINALNPYTSERFCIVFDRQLQQQSISAGVKPAPLDGTADGMGLPLAWRPSGNLLLTAAHRQISADLTKRELWLWEKNGLRHGEIALGNVVGGAVAAAAAKPAAKKATKKRRGDDEDDEDSGSDSGYTDEVDESANLDASIASATDAVVRDLAWNADSDILAVLLEDKRTGAQSIVLYTTSNYHWYLKQELRPSTPGARMHVRWHAEDARRLLVVESGGLIRFVDLIWSGCVSDTSQSRLAAVIDGQAALLTPLAKMAVPPPMSTWRITVPVDQGRINAVAMRASPVGVAQTAANACRFTLPNQKLEVTAFIALPVPEDSLPSSASEAAAPTSDMLLLTSSGTGYLLENVEGALGNAFSPASGALVDTLPGAHKFTLRSEDFPLGCLREVQWLEATSSGERLDSAATSSISPDRPAVLVAVESTPGAPDALVELDVFDGEIQGMFRTPLPAGSGSNILRAVQRKSFGHVFVQLADGRVLKYLPAAWQTELAVDDRVPMLEGGSNTLGLPCACPWFDMVSLAGVVHSVGRDALGRLHIGTQLLSPQCSSFLAAQHPLYMVFSILGAQNAVFLLDKSRTLEENLSPAFRSDPHNVRLIERGGALLALVPSLTNPRLLLQMPRGNLEAIYPRNFNLASINSALSSLRLREALVNVRRNKIDSNLLFDHFGFEGFARIARTFVAQVGDMDDTPGQGVELLNLFLSALTDESSIENQYVKYEPFPLTQAAEDMLVEMERTETATAVAGAPGKDRVRETLMRSVAAARAGAAGANDDARSDVGSLDSGVGRGGDDGGDLQSHHAVGEPAPYNYVPRKAGQSRRTMPSRDQRAKFSAATRSAEEQRRDADKKERALREQLAQQYEASAAVSAQQRKSKVNFACDLLREVFFEQEAKHRDDPKRRGRFTLCILTTYLKNEPKNYDAALQMVKTMRDEEKAQTPVAKPTATASSRSAKAAAHAAEQSSLENKSLLYRGYTGALQYMIFLSDISTLYKAALGIYDFELVRLVAQYSHMDPKEYLAFLEKLQALDSPPTPSELALSTSVGAAQRKRQPNYQHYQIDTYLQRWSKALTSLLAAWAAEEIPQDEANWALVLALVKGHPELYPQAIELATPEVVRDQTRLLIGSGGGSFGSYGARSGMYGGQEAPFDPTGGLPAHFLNPSLAPSAAAPSANSFSSFPSQSGSSGTSSSTPAAPESAVLTPYFSLVRAYAEHLAAIRTTNSSRHAAHAFLLCCDYKRAVTCLREAGEWKEAIVLAYQLAYQPEQIQQLAYELSAQLRSEPKTALAAAQMLIDYCDDVDEAVVVLLGAELWFDILRVCYSKGREDLLETHVQPEIIKAHARHTKHISTHRARYEYAVQRLRVIRRVKLLFPPIQGGMGPGDTGANDRDDDLMSIVSGMTASTSYSGVSASMSEASAFSGRSTATVASTSSIFSIQSDDRRDLTPDERRIARHQEKRRRAAATKRVKEGSIYEEDTMIKEVLETTPLDKHKERMSELIHALLHFGYIDQSRSLQFALAEFLQVVATQEATPMPMLEDPTPEQREALIAYWNWPAMAHPDRGLAPRTEHLLMPFLFPQPSQSAEAKRADQAKRELQQRTAAGTTATAAAAAAAASSGPGRAIQPKPVLEQDDDDGDMLGGFM